MITKIKPEIVGFDQKVQDEYNRIQARWRELNAKLAAVKDEIAQIKTNMGVRVAEGCDYQDECQRLADLRAETEAIQLGITCLGEKSARLKRSNTWINS